MISFNQVHSTSGKLNPKKVSLLSNSTIIQLKKLYKKDNISELLYIHFNKNNLLNECLVCSKETSFISYSKGYRKYCSVQCSGSDILKKNNSILSKQSAKIYWENYTFKESIVSDYESGLSMKCIGEKYNKSYTSIRNFLIKNNIKIRNKGYNKGEVFFQNNPNSLMLKDPKTFEMDVESVMKNACVSKNTVHVYARKCGKAYENPIGISKIEKKVVDFIKNELNISNIIENDRTILNGRELDILIPDYNVAIEVNGIYWHSEKFRDKKYHLQKSEECLKKGIHLLHIYDVEWGSGWKNKIKSILNLNERVYARKCDVVDIDYKTSKSFLDKNHIQGNIRGRQYKALVYKNKVLSVIVLGKNRFKDGIELLRYASEYGYTVVGGLSKLLSNSNINNIISYADKRYSKYDTSVFECIDETSPGYQYVVNGKLENRLKYQKHKLKDILKSFDSTKTEYENMKDNNYFRIWDCGQYVYCWNK